MVDQMTDTEVKPLRSDDVVFFPAGDEFCLHHLGSGEYYLLNELGERVWNLCDGTLTVLAITGHIADEYDAPTEEITADVIEFVEHLQREDCLM